MRFVLTLAILAVGCASAPPPEPPGPTCDEQVQKLVLDCLKSGTHGPTQECIDEYDVNGDGSIGLDDVAKLCLE